MRGHNPEEFFPPLPVDAEVEIVSQPIAPAECADPCVLSVGASGTHAWVAAQVTQPCGPSDSPPCGSQTCQLKAVEIRVVECQGTGDFPYPPNPVTCKWTKVEILSSRVVDVRMQYAGAICTHDVFPPHLLKQPSDRTFPSGTRLTFDPIAYYGIRVEGMFLNATSVSVDAPAYLSVAYGYVVGTLPTVTSITSFPLTLRAHRNGMSASTTFTITLVP